MLTTLFAKLDAAQQCGASHFLVAFSGGLDSTVLLHGCQQYLQLHPHLQLQAVHVHHGLSAHADDWAAHCQTICAAWQIPLTIERVTVPQGARISTEASAREQRYQVLYRHLHATSLLLTAHHQDDQVETLLLALKRGSGLDGLTAMPALMVLPQGHHGRPLLTVSREALEAYAQREQFNWIDDESNQDQRFDRNFIRHSVLPLMKQRWPTFSHTASRSVALLAEQRDLVDELAQHDLMACRQPHTGSTGSLQSGILLSALLALSVARRNNVLRAWLRELGAPLWSQSQLLQVWQSFALARQDANPQFEWQNWQLRRYQDTLYATERRVLDRPSSVRWPWPNALSLSELNGHLSAQHHREGLRVPHANEQVSVRFDCVGSLRVHPLGRSGSGPLKKVWQEYRVPPWLRSQVPMLFYNEHFVAAVGYWLEKDFCCANAQGWLPVWQDESLPLTD